MRLQRPEFETVNQTVCNAAERLQSAQDAQLVLRESKQEEAPMSSVQALQAGRSILVAHSEKDPGVEAAGWCTYLLLLGPLELVTSFSPPRVVQIIRASLRLGARHDSDGHLENRSATTRGPDQRPLDLCSMALRPLLLNKLGS